ncbi:uncharacterized protein BT62DRAFT_1032564 [Guyanagaster necrorhizus]|uniref:Glutathione S-transferase UstS-like C-terminal domain-containing protein n=1 Tax=Guyanagaster necrorhizus TaxID=856835 RepID=A0A9P8ARG0_9AGAR|nr:uncharacterized protein BT62DRAFT_1032564 [Guyanagaster necrorhizus MCA 3950]KAG7443827.1 hypothetical protein BT62DRAFT_1032564 [Guyanagaster necrorhizus MCA 3950]
MCISSRHTSKLTRQYYRYALNLKSLSYHTVYIKLPDVEALAKKIGAAPTMTEPDGVSLFYMIPIIQDDSTGTIISDSPTIVAYLDKTYPSSGPILIPTGMMTLQLAFSSAVVDAFTPLWPFYALGLMTKMNEVTAVYFLKGFKKLLIQVKENLGKMNKWFEGSDGNFVIGNEPYFIDMAICAFLWFTRGVVGEESEKWKDVVSWNAGRWRRYLESFKPYEKLL